MEVTVSPPMQCSYALSLPGIITACTVNNKAGRHKAMCTILHEKFDGVQSLVISKYVIYPGLTQSFAIASGITLGEFFLQPGESLWLDSDIPGPTLEYTVTLI